ncbi:unnamed protein product [Trichogramma brassicae]|uniref:C2H2-type domain-containing protein n=1 Tax=Trichogramma brassicae TaxID=86971 RepID=A0A6H5ICG8_9HYME|nr:unnamed protein product [Trichogramma brassicae]
MPAAQGRYIPERHDRPGARKKVPKVSRGRGSRAPKRSTRCTQVLLQRVTNLAIRLNNAAPCGTRIFDMKCCLSTRVYKLFNRIKIAKFIFSLKLLALVSNVLRSVNIWEKESFAEHIRKAELHDDAAARPDTNTRSAARGCWMSSSATCKISTCECCRELSVQKLTGTRAITICPAESKSVSSTSSLLTRAARSSKNLSLTDKVPTRRTRADTPCTARGICKGISFSLTRHVESLHNCITYSCDKCGKSYKQKFKLKTHIDSVHNGVTHPCDICEKIFTSKSYVKIHIEVMHKGVSPTCQMCQKTFTLKSNLRIHINEMHKNIRHSCDKCEKSFTHRVYLKNHIDVHNDVRHACDVAGDSGSPVADLDRKVVLGIVSGAANPCASGIPESHTKVSDYLMWIFYEMGNAVDRFPDYVHEGYPGVNYQ